MIAVIFEVELHPAYKQEYLDIAASLKPLLNEIDGFISIERFQSLSDPDKLLSLSFWRDEQANPGSAPAGATARQSINF
jgi:heme-degrading monooxygenase HmoA